MNSRPYKKPRKTVTFDIESEYEIFDKPEEEEDWDYYANWKDKERVPIKYDEDEDLNEDISTQNKILDPDEIEYEHIDEEEEWNSLVAMMNSFYKIQKEETDVVDDDLNEMNDMELRLIQHEMYRQQDENPTIAQLSKLRKYFFTNIVPKFSYS
jgi:hypothetical protein